MGIMIQELNYSVLNFAKILSRQASRDVYL